MSDSTTDKQRVLLVDDDKLARLSLRTVLLRLNLDVTEASKADEALALLDRNIGEFAVAVLDVKLAGSSGLDLLREIKQRDPGVEAIMVTGFETIEAAKRALRLGACDFINKPFDVSALSAAIAHALKLHESSKIALRREAELKEMLEEMGQQGIEWVRIMRGVVHDVRNMLCVVRSFHYHVSTVLSQHRQLGADDTERVKREIGVIGRQIDTIVEILNRQSSIWKNGNDSDATNVVAIIEDLVLLVQRHPEARLAEIDTIFGSRELRVRVSTNDITEVMLNLLLNAAQSSSSSVDVNIEVRYLVVAPQNMADSNGYDAVRVFGEPSAVSAGGVVSISVRDNGAGIGPEVLQRVATEQITTKGVRGSGLGLGVVVETVLRNRGIFVLRSTVGRGTEAELLLPFAGEVSPVSKILPDHHHISGGQ